MRPATAPPDAHPALAAADYAAFREAFFSSECRACALAAGRTRLVLDRGNPSARVLVLGEAPGAEEDKQGRPFVGRSGKLLDRIFASVGLDPERDLLITNVVKCRPPGNRPPKDAEAHACAGFLDRQVELLGPAVLVTLGATALKRVAPAAAFAAHVGRVLPLTLAGGRTLPGLALYHPAYLLYDPRKKEAMRAHAAALRAFLEREGLVEPSRPFGPAF